MKTSRHVASKEEVTEAKIQSVLLMAKAGFRIVYDDKDIWKGLGNRSGLHDFAQTVLDEKWEKSGGSFEKKLRKLSEVGGTFTIKGFQNMTRDRGKWVPIKSLTI